MPINGTMACLAGMVCWVCPAVYWAVQVYSEDAQA